MAVAVSGVVFVLSLARQAYALRVFSKPGVQCRRLCYHIAAGAACWAIVGGAGCLGLCEMGCPPLLAASLTVLVAASCDKYTDSGRIFVRMIAFTALRFSVPNAELREIMKLFENGQPVSSSDSQPRLSPSGEEFGISGPQNRSTSESSSNDSSRNNDSGS